MNKEVLDYNSILNNCGVGSLSSDTIIANIANLSVDYDSEEIISIYNYLLHNTQEPEVLIGIIKLADNYRAASTLSILLEILKFETMFNSDEEEKYVDVRIMCAKAISNYKDTSTVVTLLDCMNNKKEHYRVRLACADALGRIGDKYAVKPLIDLIEDEEEKSVYLKESATFALGILGDVSAIDPLVSILESKHGFLGKFTFLKEKIVEALGKLNFNNKKVLNALKNSLMDSSPMVRINAIEAIMNSESDDAIDLISPCLMDEDDDVKKNALIALYNLSGRNILDDVLSSSKYSTYLKNEAQDLIDEYEDDESE